MPCQQSIPARAVPVKHVLLAPVDNEKLSDIRRLTGYARAGITTCMGNSNTSNAGTGIGLGGAVFIVFLILKLIGIEPVAAWSWWWITAPLWIPLGLALIVASVIVIGVVISDGLASRRAIKRMMRD